LKAQGSADILVRSRVNGDNPFAPFNAFAKSKHLPNTRLETFVFETEDIEEYFRTQKSRGVRFISDRIIHAHNFSFIQTIPSSLTGGSIGFIQWTGERGNYAGAESQDLSWQTEKPGKDYLKNIKGLDHAATRVRAEDRDAAIIEFMQLTNYDFDFAIYVTLFNSITNVARLSKDDFAMVFTSGISPYTSDQESGPTEKFIHNYGTRVHHMAFHTENIEETFSALKQDGMDFLIDLVGSPDEGLKQTFTVASEHTLLVNEYIHRYGDFDGFFTKSNVTLLTGATDMQ
jgi:4-hydroxyphenylpyruvate dioxygenase-like putative hemolysin